MDANVLSALSALLGAIVGGGITFFFEQAAASAPTFNHARAE